MFFRTIAQELDPALLFREVVGSPPDPWQEILLRSRSNKILLNICRQSGKTVTTSVLGLHQALYTPNSLVLIFAPTQNQSRELFLKVKSYAREAEDIQPDQENAQRLVLNNGSRIISLSGNPDSSRGYSAPNLVIVDEAAFVKDELFYALRPMIRGNARFILLSTPNARAGYFYEIWSGARTGWEMHEVTCYNSPQWSPAAIREAQLDMPAFKFAREMECKFGVSEGGFIPETLIAGLADPSIQPLF